MREEGMLNREIEEKEGIKNAGAIFKRAKDVYGLKVPRSPYYWPELP